MIRQELPWVLTEEPKIIKEKREEMQLKEVIKKGEENLPVSVARIMKFLNKNKNQRFSNTQISAETGVRNVAGIMDKLEEIGMVETSFRKYDKQSKISVYRSIVNDSRTAIPVERMYDGYATRILAVFRGSKNKTYTKAALAELTEIDIKDIGNILCILLITEEIKVVGVEDGALVYQNINGNKKAVVISKEADGSYMTLGNYIKLNNIKEDIKELKVKLSEEKGHSRLFYSTHGIVKEYEVSYLQKMIGLGKKKGEKKGLLERIKVWS